MIRVTI